MSEEHQESQAPEGAAVAAAPATTAGEPVLSEAEVDALLTGVQKGIIEVQSSGGPRFANVSGYEIPARSRIATKSLPKLDVLNIKLAERLSNRTEQLVGVDVEVSVTETGRMQFGDIVELCGATVAAVEFAAPPLPGTAGLIIDADLVSMLVELYFGGAANSLKTDGFGQFTPGVLRVIDSYSKVVLAALKSSWSTVQSLEPEIRRTESNVGHLGIAEDTDSIVRAVFDYSIREHNGSMMLLLPEKTIAAQLPAFEGKSKAAAPGDQERWSSAIRGGLPGVTVDLATTVGHATMTLGELICLEPGDIIPINNPTTATVLANDVRLMQGRFGVHAGRNAFAAGHWLAGAAAADDARK